MWLPPDFPGSCCSCHPGLLSLLGEQHPPPERLPLESCLTLSTGHVHCSVPAGETELHSPCTCPPRQRHSQPRHMSPLGPGCHPQLCGAECVYPHGNTGVFITMHSSLCKEEGKHPECLNKELCDFQRRFAIDPPQKIPFTLTHYLIVLPVSAAALESYLYLCEM